MLLYVCLSGGRHQFSKRLPATPHIAYIAKGALIGFGHAAGKQESMNGRGSLVKVKSVMNAVDQVV